MIDFQRPNNTKRHKNNQNQEPRLLTTRIKNLQEIMREREKMEENQETSTGSEDMMELEFI